MADKKQNNTEKQNLESEEQIENTAKKENQAEEMSDAEVNSKKESKPFFGKNKTKEIEDLKVKIEEITAEKLEFQDKFLRLYSEFDNYKKRTQKEKLDIINTASERLILDILPTLDNFERAIKVNSTSEDLEQVKQGFELIYNGLMTVLKQKGLTQMVSVGEKFDTDFHEAVTFVPAENEAEKGIVFDEVVKGYKLGDKVIRFAKVVTKN